jgi:hypothetical protein
MFKKIKNLFSVITEMRQFDIKKNNIIVTYNECNEQVIIENGDVDIKEAYDDKYTELKELHIECENLAVYLEAKISRIFANEMNIMTLDMLYRLIDDMKYDIEIGNVINLYELTERFLKIKRKVKTSAKSLENFLNPT